MLSDETKKTLTDVMGAVGDAIALLPYAGCAAAGPIVKAWGGGLLITALQLVGVKEVIFVTAENGAEVTGTADLRDGT